MWYFAVQYRAHKAISSYMLFSASMYLTAYIVMVQSGMHSILPFTVDVCIVCLSYVSVH